jgi:hypothetical protein
MPGMPLLPGCLAVLARDHAAFVAGPRRLGRQPHRLGRRASPFQPAAPAPRTEGPAASLGGPVASTDGPSRLGRRGRRPGGCAAGADFAAAARPRAVWVTQRPPPLPPPPPADAPAAAARPSRLRRRCDLHARCAGSHVHEPLANLLRTRAAIRSAAYGGASSGSSIGGSGTKNGGGCSRSFCFGSGLDHSRPHTACFSSGIHWSRAPATASVTSTSSCMPRSG